MGKSHAATLYSEALGQIDRSRVGRTIMPSIRFHRTGLTLAVLVFYLISTADAFSASAPTTVSQLALYQGADREKILIEGAKREGQFTLYDSHTWFRTIAKEFEKKYPFIKVSEFRTDGRNLIKRALEEIAAGQYIADVIATTTEQMAIMKREGVFQEYALANALLPRRRQNERTKRFLLCRTLRDLQQLGVQHFADPCRRSTENHERSLEPEMERENVHRQYYHRDSMDRQHLECYGTRVP